MATSSDQIFRFQALVRSGIMTINEARGELGLPPIPGGDVAFIMTENGAIPVDSVEDYARKELGFPKRSIASKLDKIT